MCPNLFQLIGGVVQAAFWIFLIGGGVWLFRRAPRRRARRYDPIRRSMSVLNERYARGDIDRDEYLERKAYLE